MNKNWVFKNDPVQRNDYGIFVTSISIWYKDEVAEFSSLFTLTPM